MQFRDRYRLAGSCQHCRTRTAVSMAYPELKQIESFRL